MSSQVVIDNPIINSLFEEPGRHFKFSDERITNEIAEGRRTSSYFVPIAKPKKKGAKQLQFDTEWTQDRIEENKLVNQIRARVGLWRQGGYLGVTATTARLLEYWTDPAREKKLFFCQIEALETAIYITCAPHVILAQSCGERWQHGAMTRWRPIWRPTTHSGSRSTVNLIGKEPCRATRCPPFPPHRPPLAPGRSSF